MAGCGIQIDTRNSRPGALADRPAPMVCAARAAATGPLPPFRQDPGAESTAVIAIGAADHGEQRFCGGTGGPSGSGFPSVCCRLHLGQRRPGATTRAHGSSLRVTKKLVGATSGKKSQIASPLPENFFDLCNHGRITDCIAPRQPVQHRPSLTTTASGAAARQIPPATRHFGPTGERHYSIAMKVALRYQKPVA
jgi:hypothetical protein